VSMKHINAEDAQYALAELFGTSVLFNKSRIEKSSVPEDLNYYAIRHRDDDVSTAATLENSVTVNYMGAVLSAVAFDLGDAEYLEIDVSNGDFKITDEQLDISEYRQFAENQAQTQTHEPTLEMGVM